VEAPWKLEKKNSWKMQKWIFVNLKLLHLKVEQPKFLQAQPS
jgi:hypothetical protein